MNIPQTLKMKVAHRLGSRLFTTACVELTDTFKEDVKRAIMLEKYPHMDDSAKGFEYYKEFLKPNDVTQEFVNDLRKFL